jgi:serine/threonine protein kinase/tetratricopeptide (TPR) repeat protein
VDELNREFLAAVLAVLTDAAPGAGLAAALEAWSTNRDQPLARAFKTVTGVDDELFRTLESLAGAHLKTHQDDLRQSLIALNAQKLTENLLTAIDDHALRTTLGATLGCESTIPMDQATPGGPALGFSMQPGPVPTDERFQLIREHAKGGIGQVWLARDTELQRDVAVKEIQPKYAEQENQRARFVVEAEITGSLEHPGVVPVYSLGRNAAGRPYYAMRFIRGESLSVEIQKFHKRFGEEVALAGAKGVGRSKWGVEFRQLMGRFLDVCDAIDYAHSRGVLHRDLKPANIMLGPYGETLVVDWGLAKVIGKSEAPRQAAEGDFEPAQGEASETIPYDATQQGTTIGTPAYMSPEQASGLIDQLGPASDVYSLGASLFELITGKAPFHERKIAEVIAKVKKGDFPPPRSVDRSIPAPLDAICMKAMANAPEGRYGSVRALAQDLEHWLADEPTEAYPESRVEKLTRWFRQHRAWTVPAAAALVCISMVAIIAALVIEGARHQEQVARVEAETNFDMAQRAVEDYLINVSENTLLKEQDSLDIRSLRDALLRSALTYYEQFAAQRKNDPRLRQQLAKAYFRVGQITREIGSTAQAMGAFRSALAIWQPLVEASPKEHELAGNLADCYLAMGRIESSDGDFRAAREDLDRSRTILERLWQENAEEPRYQSSLADCYSEIGIALAKLEMAHESLDIHEKARVIQQRLIDRYPDNLAYKRGFAENLVAIGFAQHKRKDNDAALTTFHEVQDFCQKLMKAVSYGPKPTWLLNSLALSQYDIGAIHKQKGELENALPFFEASIKYQKDLADLHPSVTKFREKLGISYREIAELEHQAHQDDKEISSIKMAIDVYADLVRSQPEAAGFQNILAWCWDDLGIRFDEVRNHTEAMVAFDRAVNEQRAAIAKPKSADGSKLNLCYYLDNLGEQSIDLGRPEEGLPSYQQAIQMRRDLRRAHPLDRLYTIELVRALGALGNIRRHMGEAEPARRSFAEARKTLAEALKSTPGDPALQVELAVALANEAALLADSGQAEKAKPLLEDAVARFRRAANRTAPAGELALDRERRSETLWNLRRVSRDLKLHLDADRSDAERTDLWKTRVPDELVELAIKHLNQATLIGHGKAPLSAQGAAVRELDLNQAVDDLKLAIRCGLKDPGKLKVHPESDLLLTRIDVESAIKDPKSLETRSGARQVNKSDGP